MTKWNYIFGFAAHFYTIFQGNSENPIDLTTVCNRLRQATNQMVW